MRRKITSLLILFFSFTIVSHAQLPDGSTAPDWTLTDINGTTHNLYSYLDAGKTVYIDFFATWCGPCWNYHTSHAMEDLYNMYGPNGTDEVMVFAIEADASTTLADIYGTGSNTVGDWTAGTPYPIIEGASLNSPYQINYFPTIYGICPDRTIVEVGQVGTSSLYAYHQSCPLPGVHINEIAVEDTDCFGSSNGAIAINATGYPGPFTYSWSNGMSGSNISGLTTGTYYCTISNPNGDSEVAGPIQVSGSPAPMSIGIVDIQSPNCYGEMGAITALASGGDGNFFYRWNNGQVSSTISNLQAGTYTVTATDGFGCTASIPATIFPPVMPDAFISSIGEVTCDNPTVALDASGSFSQGILEYLWTTTDGNYLSAGNSSIAIVDAPGEYYLSVRDLDNGCYGSASINVQGNITAPTVDAGVDTTINCNNAQITLTGEADSGDDISYEWSTDDGNIVEGASTLTPLIDAAGIYTLTASNADNGCEASASMEVTADFNTPNIEIADADTLGCYNTTVIINALASDTGDGLVYEWTTIAGNIAEGADGLSPVVDAAGTYTFAITNSNNGCVSEDSVMIEEVPGVEITNIEITDAACYGEASGSVSIEASGDEPLTYLWSSGSTTATINSVYSGTQIFTITDVNGCEITGAVEIGQPEELVLNASAQGETSFEGGDGSVAVEVSGGEEPYTYEWNNGVDTQSQSDLLPGVYSVTVTDANGCASSQTVTVTAFDCNWSATLLAHDVSCNGANDGIIIPDVTGGEEPVSYAWSNGETFFSIVDLAPGDYSVTITDTNDCVLELSASIQEPAALDLNISVTNESANGASDGSLDATVNGGTAPYSYLWSNDSTSQDLSGLTAGTYTLTVTDANDCTAEETLEVITFACDLEVEVLSTTPASCHGECDGGVVVVINGGTAPYTATFNGEDLVVPGGIPLPIDGLCAGIYEAVVTDANNCETNVLVEITSPEALDIMVSEVVNPSCAAAEDGVIQVEVSGGTGLYTFTWSMGENADDRLGHLGVGSYSLTVADANGCTSETTVALENGDEESPVAIAQDVMLELDEEGIAQLSWDMADNGSTDNCAIDTTHLDRYEFTCDDIGEHTVEYVAMDTAGNTDTTSFTVTVVDNMAPSITVNTPNIGLDENGVATVSVDDVFASGSDNCGIASMSLNVDTFDCSQLGAQDVVLTVVDVSGNVTSMASTVMVVDEIAPVLTCPENIEMPYCERQVNYDLPLVSDNCGESGTLEMVNGIESGALFPTGMTTVAFEYTDAGGQIGSCSFDVSILEPLEFYSETLDIRCDNPESGAVLVDVEGGAYTYEWNTGADTLYLWNIGEGEYILTVTDTYGCEDVLSFTLSAPEMILDPMTVIAFENEMEGDASGSITMDISEELISPMFTWYKDGEEYSHDISLTGLSAGVYVLEIRDILGCVYESDEVIIDNVVGVRDIYLENGFSLTPNPATDRLWININDNKQATSYVVIDLLGQKVMNGDIRASGQNIELNVSQLAAGTYFVKVEIGEKFGIQKVLIQ